MKKIFSLEQIAARILEKGFTLVSKEYMGNYARITVMCSKGHCWDTSWKMLSRGQVCPVCNWPPCPKKYDAGFKQDQLENARKVAIEKGGNCLSTVYTNNRDLLEFCCSNGHTWKTTYKNVVGKNSWCPKCLQDNYLSIEDLKAIASQRGGYCLSTTRSIKKLRWQCYFGHEWEASVGNVVGKNSWCPICASGFSEEVCRHCLEALTGHKFPKSHPTWLRNRRNNQLYFDGFCEELQLAFEHQGEQHFHKLDCFDYDQQKAKENDEDKLISCTKNGVSIICIPSLGYRLKPSGLVEFLCRNLERNNIEICVKDLLVDDIYLIVRKIQRVKLLDEYKKMAENKAKEHGGRFIGMNDDNFSFECGTCGNMWDLSNPNGKSWCPNCAILKRRKTLDDAKTLAISKKGLCLSTKYSNNHTKMLWQCIKGHIWESTYNNIRHCWCPYCNRPQKPNIIIARSLAISRGGECLSTEYINNHTKMLWQCALGHKWFSTYNNIKNNHWCPVCSGRVKIGL